MFPMLLTSKYFNVIKIIDFYDWEIIHLPSSISIGAKKYRNF